MRRISPPHACPSIDIVGDGTVSHAAVQVFMCRHRASSYGNENPKRTRLRRARNHSARQRTRAAGDTHISPTAFCGQRNGGERVRENHRIAIVGQRDIFRIESHSRASNWTARFFRSRRQSECLCLLALRPKPIPAGSYQPRTPSSSALLLQQTGLIFGRSWSTDLNCLKFRGFSHLSSSPRRSCHITPNG